MRSWIRHNTIPAIFIALAIVTTMAFGIWSGVTYLTDEIRYFSLEPRGGLIERQETVGIIYHHTAASDRPITSHHEWHLFRGWSMVGYNYHIRTDGTIEAGRPHNIQGAHVKGQNHRTIGIAFSGDLDEYPPTIQQYESAIELQWWLEEYQGYGVLEISGHNDWSSTSCPGKFMDLDVIRQGVIAKRAGVEDDEEEEVPDTSVPYEVIKGMVGDIPVSGYLIDSTTYVPIRVIAEELGYDVLWNPELRQWHIPIEE